MRVNRPFSYENIDKKTDPINTSQRNQDIVKLIQHQIMSLKIVFLHQNTEKHSFFYIIFTDPENRLIIIRERVIIRASSIIDSDYEMSG